MPVTTTFGGDEVNVALVLVPWWSQKLMIVDRLLSPSKMMHDFSCGILTLSLHNCNMGITIYMIMKR